MITMIIADRFYSIEEIMQSTDLSFKASRTIFDPKYVPAIGSRIYLGYVAAPKVVDVIYELDKEFIFVICE